MNIQLPESLRRIQDAAERIAPYIRPTPTVNSYTLSESTGHETFLKLENLQRTGSFKVRGALAKLLALDPELRRRGLIAASAGNHSQGVALAAQMLETEARIVMPESTAWVKVQRTEGYGAQVLLHGRTWDEAQARAIELAAEHGWTIIHPFDDLEVIEGQGTVALEILADVEDLDTLLVPVGGGGLLAGVLLAVKALRPELRVIGVQAAGAPSMVQSLADGVLTRVDPATIAEGIRVGRAGELTFEIAKALLDDSVTVTEQEITEALVQTMEKSKVVVEAGGVVGVAALMAGKVAQPGRTCVVLSGGNIDINQLSRYIESGLSAAGRTHLIRLRTPDQPGQLARIAEILAREKTNILDIQHYRAGWKVPVGFVDVEVLIETRTLAQAHKVEQGLLDQGMEIRGTNRD